ncbi:MCE family protein [Mycolicibacterium holsaticum]|uniref:MCE family protein n=1 Tax=Mycolicibacterium holsaticum TaxID=152142 RepID=UPI001C7CBFAD|nr:MCE family protein [Mycolicibacterium holsaticum]QZA11757.1 MCE family protein [Mycolicibacterium holsaticum DSM 44478 = JCM 12374]UNC10756.1 MCE family protein [Mycolicibacterium holsaticum DSM 44478 = JCM 12374]
MRHRWVARRGVALLLAALLLTSCGNWRGIANVPLPGGPGTRADAYTIYVQVPETLALTVNSRVLVADVFVGRVRAIELKDWIATLTLDMKNNVQLPENATATIGQTSLLGSQHVALAVPPNPSPQLLKDGDTIPLKNSSAYPTVERTLASFATVLNGGGIPNLEVIQNEAYNILSGRADQIHDFFAKLATFTAELNRQRDDIIRAIDSTNQLLARVADRSDTLDRVLTEFPPLIEHFADQQGLLADAVEAAGRVSTVSDKTASDARADLALVLRLLLRPLRELGRAAPYLIDTLKWVFTQPFPVDTAEKVLRGDYTNISATFDLTLSAIDNAMLTGTGFSGALRALEQSWGRDPSTMIPDVRYNPNPADAPAERAE